MKKRGVILLTAATLLLAVTGSKGQSKASPVKKPTDRFVHKSIGNPYLPLWEHLPDGEPRVFEDPDKPGKFRAYII